MKVQDLLAIIGGLMKTLLVIGRFLVKPISKLSLHTELVNELFVFEEQRNRSMRKSIIQLNSVVSNNFEFGTIEKQNDQIPQDYNLLQQENNLQCYENNNEQVTPQPRILIQNQKQARGSILKVKTPYNNELNNDFTEPNLIQRRANTPKKIELFPVEYNGNFPVKNTQSLFQKEASEAKQFKQDMSSYRKESDEKKTNQWNDSSQQNRIISNNSLQIRNNFEYKTPTQNNTQSNHSRFKKTDLKSPSSKMFSQGYSPSSRSQRSQIITQFQLNSPISKEQNNMTSEKKQINYEQMQLNQGKSENNTIDKFEVVYEITEFPNQKSKSETQIQEQPQNPFYVEKLKLDDQTLNGDSITRRGNKHPSENFQNQNGISPGNYFDIQQNLKKSQSHQPPRNYSNRPSHLQIQRLKEENKDFMAAVKNMPKQTFGRQGTKLITNFLQQNYEVHRGKRKATRKEQTEANVMFSNVLDQVQEKPLHFTFFDYIKYYFTKLKCISKKKQIKYSVKKVTERLDIVYILQKLVEIDKLKVLLLSYEQQKLFEYMPRPVVQSDPEMQEIQWNRNKTDLLKAWTLLNSENGNLDKFTEAFHAYKQISKKIEKEPLDERLIQMLDPDVKRYFDRTQVDTSQISTPHKGSHNNTLLKKQIQPRGSLFKHMIAPPSQISQTSPQESKSMIECSQQISKTRRSSSYIEKTANQADTQSKLLSSSHILNKYQNQEDKSGIRNYSLSHELNKLHLNLKLNVGKSEVSPAASTKSQKIKNSQSNENQLFVKNPEVNNQKSHEQIETIGDDEEGQVSYPRTSIYVNNVEFINQMKDNNNYQELNSNSRYAQMNIENQFSFTRKSVESPYFVFDFQRKSSQNRSTFSGRFNGPSKYSNMQQSIGVGMDQSKEAGQPESFDNYNNSYNSPDRISSANKFSSHKQSQFLKLRSLSQQEFENTNEYNPDNNSVHNQIHFYPSSQNKNYSFGNQISQDNMSQSNTGKTERSSILRQAAVLTSSCKIDDEQNTKNQRNRQVSSFAPKQVSLFYNIPNSSQEGTQDEQSYKQQSSQEEFGQSPPLFPHRAFVPNSSQLQLKQTKHRKNTSSLGSLNNVSIRKNDSFNINNSQQRDSPMIDFEKSASPEPRLIINNVQTNFIPALNGQDDHNKQFLDPNKLNDSFRNQVNHRLTSCSSFQTIPEENIKSRQEGIKFNQINPNKFEDENSFKLINNQLPLEFQPQQNTPLNAHKSYENQVIQPSNYHQSPPINELISPRESVQIEHLNINNSHEKRINPFQQPQNTSQNNSPQHEMLLFKNYGIGSQMFFKENTSINNPQQEEIEYRPIRNAETIESETNNNYHINYQNLNNYSSKPQIAQYNTDNQNSQKQQQQKSSFYNNFQSPRQIDLTDDNQRDNVKDNQDNQLKQPQIYRYSSINFNMPQYQKDRNEVQNQQNKIIESKSSSTNQQAQKYRTSLNLQLNLGSNFVQSGAQSPQVSNFLKQNNNAKLYESPYTRQQKFLKKKQQEKYQNYSKQESSQNNNYQNPSTPSMIKSIRNKEQIQDIFNFEHIRTLDNMSSLDRSVNKSIYTPNQINKQQNTSYIKEKGNSKTSFNEELLLTTETEEQNAFVKKEKKQLLVNTSEQIIDMNSTLNIPSHVLLNRQSITSIPFNQIKRESIHEALIPINTKRNNIVLINNSQQQIESSPFHLLKVSEQDNFQTLNSESDAIVESNKIARNDITTTKDVQDQKLKRQGSKTSNDSIICFDDRNSEY